MPVLGSKWGQYTCTRCGAGTRREECICARCNQHNTPCPKCGGIKHNHASQCLACHRAEVESRRRRCACGLHTKYPDGVCAACRRKAKARDRQKLCVDCGARIAHTSMRCRTCNNTRRKGVRSADPYALTVCPECGGECWDDGREVCYKCYSTRPIPSLLGYNEKQASNDAGAAAMLRSAVNGMRDDWRNLSERELHSEVTAFAHSPLAELFGLVLGMEPQDVARMVIGGR